MIITSPANERVKHARRVREGREEGVIFVEGERLVEECLESGLPLAAAFHLPEPGARTSAILGELARRGCPLFAVTEAVMATLRDTVHPQGIVVLAGSPRFTLDGILSPRGAEPPLVVCLDAVQDPGNFGTILRTAEAAGATGVLATKGSVDLFTPKTLRSAMGSAFRLPAVTGVSADELLARAREAGIEVVATAAVGECAYTEYDWRRPALIVFGNEARGVTPELLERADVRLRIPLRPPVESLNVAASAAAILFEAARQREKGEV
ncbi:MAG: TrmH family RNA methyltransferase [Blastocatellia bacterium]